MFPPMSAWSQKLIFYFHSGSSQSSEETKMEVEEDATTDDLFKDFDLDTCLMNDGLPLWRQSTLTSFWCLQKYGQD